MYSSDGLFSMTIGSNGKNFQEFFSNDLTQINVGLGEQFQISLRNNTARRAVAVVGVDGLCIVDGQEFSTNGIGYICEPRSIFAIENWRVQTSHWLPLQFGKLPVGFEKFMDQPTRIGIIEATFFYEQEKPVYSKNWLQQVALGLKKPSRLTGWSANLTEEIILQQFAKEGSPAATMIISYQLNTP